MLSNTDVRQKIVSRVEFHGDWEDYLVVDPNQGLEVITIPQPFENLQKPEDHLPKPEDIPAATDIRCEICIDNLLVTSQHRGGNTNTHNTTQGFERHCNRPVARTNIQKGLSP